MIYTPGANSTLTNSRGRLYGYAWKFDTLKACELESNASVETKRMKSLDVILLHSSNLKFHTRGGENNNYGGGLSYDLFI